MCAEVRGSQSKGRFYSLTPEVHCMGSGKLLRIEPQTNNKDNKNDPGYICLLMYVYFGLPFGM